MINNTEFAKRLKKIMDYYQFSASVFADKIKVQRSSISHLLSGRNKPSLDFVLKVINEFDEVELYWLLKGKGSFPRTQSPTISSTPLENSKPKKSPQRALQKEETPNTLVSFTPPSNGKKIERIVLFYTDGTFKEYIN